MTFLQGGKNILQFQEQASKFLIPLLSLSQSFVQAEVQAKKRNKEQLWQWGLS